MAEDVPGAAAWMHACARGRVTALLRVADYATAQRWPDGATPPGLNVRAGDAHPRRRWGLTRAARRSSRALGAAHPRWPRAAHPIRRGCRACVPPWPPERPSRGRATAPRTAGDGDRRAGAGPPPKRPWLSSRALHRRGRGTARPRLCQGVGAAPEPRSRDGTLPGYRAAAPAAGAACC